MKREMWDVVVIGGGPAGLAAAYQARESGAGRVLILERNRELGGILTQCVHNGFGVRVFGEDLTGPEYAERWVGRALGAGVQVRVQSMVLEIGPGPRVVVSGAGGLTEYAYKSLVLAMGCRERPRGALGIPGTRPSGVYTAGTAQRLVNIEGYMPGERFVILGSGDIGMIMARRLTLEGAHVEAMVEILPYVSGLRRNLAQCIRDFDIPLYLCTTVTQVCGRDRVEAVVISEVDKRWEPVPGTARELECDCFLLSVGLVPENELSRMAHVTLDARTGGPVVDERMATSVQGIFAAGNVVHVYDLVDDVSESALRAGRHAAEYALGKPSVRDHTLEVRAGKNVRHVVPQSLRVDGLRRETQRLEFRVREPIESAVGARVLVDDRLVEEQRFRYARPSEMLSLDLAPNLVSALVDGEALTVEVVARDAVKAG